MCVPGLHLSLGIFDRLWTLLEDDCKQLDLRLAEADHGEGGIGGDTFIQYSVALQQKASLTSQLDSQMAHVNMLEQLATFLSLSLPEPENSEPLHAVRSEAAVARSKAEQMV